ncbi:hypothetical protein FM106_00910 [Brachybacterium faecium]|nr:hypothetical protein FM106_00910 [Brachybacterium faecium]
MVSHYISPLNCNLLHFTLNAVITQQKAVKSDFIKKIKSKNSNRIKKKETL